MTDKLHEYLNVLLPKCLLSYQFIEECLRQCLYRQHAIAHRKLNGLLPYNPPLESINNVAMGKLVQYFQTFSDDDQLISLLNQVRENRNTVAHQGYLMTYEEQNNQEVIERKHMELKSFLSQAQECLAMVQAELVKLEDIVNKEAEKASGTFN